MTENDNRRVFQAIDGRFLRKLAFQAQINYFFGSEDVIERFQLLVVALWKFTMKLDQSNLIDPCRLHDCQQRFRVTIVLLALVALVVGARLRRWRRTRFQPFPCCV